MYPTKKPMMSSMLMRGVALNEEFHVDSQAAFTEI